MVTGRPALYTEPWQLEAAVQEYFDQDGKKTVTGLAYHLGFESRQSFYDYEEKSDFTYIIRRARLKIESGYEENLQGTTPTGSIFALKNMGWKDQSQIEQSGSLSINWNEEKTYETKS
jgi:hypothetical protein